ncbi:murein DD-endopeptidase MepM/ murein hydrolase activator NlpD [Keratinibaculum paraultunense]|uniref:Murein DD-endopeptidase MepM/ murein hydrolase activator NlpD n=1 Tax=Keratinibaculum paraultunense TaxID=1278232 RepID=A0A4R3KQ95_9FIRM|nr:peptidoglycan DD-metalloendopeptidase family protein [Keratinibaculum paraultunense]QQY79743.1 peptidoglycan DD-metalloendopeptidase family protein [Keratinibaculum paraultunense]TCS86948.1 murein DD-endopeptidase MepM/ murein hydrolase activator NlpD [Keratinibaculum paraultunense]
MDEQNNLETGNNSHPPGSKLLLGETKNKFNFKKVLIMIILVTVTSLSTIVYKVNEIRTRAFIVSFGNENVGIVRDKEQALNILEELRQELVNKYDIDIVLNENITFKDTHAKDNMLASMDELRENIKSKMTFLVSGYILLVDNEEVGATRTKEDLEEVLDKIKDLYIKDRTDDGEIKEIKFLEDIKIEKRNVPLNKLKSKDELFNYILSGEDEVKTHVVEVGESLWTISKIYDIPVEDLIAVNPDKDPEKLQIGDEIKLLMPKSMVTVATVEEVKYNEKIDYEVKVEYDKSMYKTNKKVKVKGSQGESEIIAKVVKHNGIIVDKEIIEEKIVKEPVDELIVKGTKDVPKTIATGAFLMPTRGSISSRYGMRNGRMHKGIDIIAKKGTPIKAADGGKVVFAGRNGAYGNLVEIDHGNGYITRYGHCSSINVKVGERVYKGQVIAKVGSTGRASGSHLHFEVLKNGRNQNPSKYVR